MTAYEILAQEAKDLGLPKRYNEDLHVIDKEAISYRPPGTPFLWSIGDCGTGIDFDGCMIDMIKGYSDWDYFYFFDGTNLVQIGPEDVSKYINLVGKGWTINNVREYAPNFPYLIAEINQRQYKAKVMGRKNDFATVSAELFYGKFVTAEFAWETIVNILNGSKIARFT